MPEHLVDATGGRLARLLGYLQSDPDNLALLSEAAEAALVESQPSVASELLARYARNAPLPDKEINLSGLAHMQEQRFETAAELFRGLLRKTPQDAAVRFNLAWSLAMLKDTAASQDLLDDATVHQLPQAAALRVQLLHDQGQFEEAFEFAKNALDQHPDHAGLLAATSVLAMDVEDVDLARSCALRAGSQPQALVTLGMLALDDNGLGDALDLFSQALVRDPHAPRAWVGKGLALLSRGNPEEATISLQHGAELFGEHVGSWIAAGWAHIVTNNLDAAQSCFEQAFALDHNFAESHGSLAVVKLLRGNVDEARRLTQTALRLDPNSFSTALARALLLSEDGRPNIAHEIIQRALNTPMDATGRTLAKMIARNALNR
jgi:tetratricopeptide (TPR) repeat protein